MRGGGRRSQSDLVEGNAPGQQLDQISGSQDDVRVEGFLRGRNGHAALDQVQRGFDVLREEERGGRREKEGERRRERGEEREGGGERRGG